MTYEWQDIFEEEVDADGHIPQGCLDAQRMLDSFVEINYETALDAARMHVGGIDVNHIQQQIVDIIRNNPPLKTVSTYFRDGRENYLWYSDFYDDAGKDVFGEYRRFTASDTKITPTKYTIELAKIDLPYFKALVDLVSLVKLEQEAERKKVSVVPASEPIEDAPPVTANEDAPTVEPIPQPDTLPVEELKPKRSYEPKLSNEQYALLAGCVEKIKLFRRPVTAAQLKKLLTGKLTEPLQVMNQLPLVYLLDEMRDKGYIKKAWMTVATENRDFISFRTPGQERRYGSEPHYLTMDQLKSRRSDSKRVYIDGGHEIDDMIEQMQECDGK